jgi:hypothetical protein
MTVSSSTNRVSYSGNGTLTTFAYTFKVFDQGDLTVILRSSTGTETVQTITTHYTVTGVGDVGGGNVVFVTAPSATETVVILREQDLTQGLDLVPNDPFPAQSLEESLDKLTFMVQQHEEELGRAIKASRTNTLTGSEFTISAADRANKVFSFDSSGDLSVTQELGTFKGDWAASTAYVERDLVKDTTTNNVFIVTSAHTSSGSLPLTTNTNSDKYEKIIDITNPPGDVTFGGSITTSSSVTAGSFVIGSADINENDLEAIDSVTAGTVAASKAVVVDVNKDISSFRNLTATGDITFGGLSDGTITVTAFVDEDNMASDSATLVPTQQSVKAYVDAQVATADTLTEILGNGNTTSGANIQMTTTDELQFRDTALKINSSADGQLDIDADTEVEITAPTVDINASTEVNISGAAKIGGTLNIDTINELTTNAGTTINSTFIGNNKIGIGTSVVGDTQVAIRGSAAKLRLESLTAGNHNWDVGVFSTSFRIYHQATGQNPFWIDSTDNVGIGTISPSTKLDVNGTVTATGGAFTGDVSFGDNDKAIFGAGSDLQIYSDGTTGQITGDLNITGTLTSDGLTVDKSGSSIVTTLNRSDSTFGYINFKNTETTTGFVGYESADFVVYADNAKVLQASDGGDISFYEDTGTTAKFFWDASAESLGIGTSAINGTLDIANSDQTNGVTLSLTNSFAGSGWTAGDTIGTINFRTDDTSTTEPIRGQIKVFDDATVSGTYAGNNAMSFSTGYINALYERMRIDSSGNVGIGTDSPASKLHVSGGSGARADVQVTYDALGTASGDGAQFGIQSGGAYLWNFENSATYFATNNTERMRIDSSGNVGIGTSSPATNLEVRNATAPATFKLVQSGNGTFTATTTTLSTTLDATDANASLLFSTGSSERMRIDSSGNLLVGTTDDTLYNNGAGGNTGVVLRGSVGNIQAARSDGAPIDLNRLDDDGDIAVFQKDGSTVGSIGSFSGSYLSVGSGDTGLMFHSVNNIIYPHNTSTNSTIDDAISLGSISTRFRSLFLSNGVYLGGVTSSNLLDDYEEGTYQSSLTPNTSGTITLLTSYDVLSYTKVGRAVTVTGDLVITATSSPVGTSVELALPFTIGDLAELSGRIGGAVSLYDASASRTVKAYVGIEGNSYINVIVDPNTLTTSDSITISLTYFTA